MFDFISWKIQKKEKMTNIIWRIINVKFLSKNLFFFTKIIIAGIETFPNHDLNFF